MSTPKTKTNTPPLTDFEREARKRDKSPKKPTAFERGVLARVAEGETFMGDGVPDDVNAALAELSLSRLIETDYELGYPVATAKGLRELGRT